VKNTDELVVVLAAGVGSRLKPFTDELPKCLVPISGIPLLSLSTAQMKKAGLDNILIVGGYKKEILEREGYDLVPNPEFRNSNMVWSLTQATDYIQKSSCDYVIVHYGDIVVSYQNILLLRGCDNQFSLLADKNWKELWQLRMSNYLEDIETFVTKQNKLIELGKKVYDEKDVEAQYMGVIRIKRDLLLKVLLEFKVEVNGNFNGAQKLKNMFMTDFIQRYIDSGGIVSPIYVDGGWLELDTIDDLSLYESKKGKKFFKEILSG
jgi:L-glutamine-phosphate cytidylyltransferase